MGPGGKGGNIQNLANRDLGAGPLSRMELEEDIADRDSGGRGDGDDWRWQSSRIAGATAVGANRESSIWELGICRIGVFCGGRDQTEKHVGSNILQITPQPPCLRLVGPRDAPRVWSSPRCPSCPRPSVTIKIHTMTILNHLNKLRNSNLGIPKVGDQSKTTRRVELL